MKRLEYVVIGLGQFGRHLAVTLSREGCYVIALDSDPVKIDEIKDLVARAVRANCADERVLHAARVHECECAVVALGEESFEDTTMAVAALANMKVKRIIARSSSPLRGRILQMVGAHSVIFPEIQAAEQVGHSIRNPGLQASLALPSGYTLAQVTAPATLAGQTLAASGIRQKRKVSVIAVKRTRTLGDQKVERTLEAEPDLLVEEGDMLVVVGLTENVDALGREVV
jgi:trk system potassium uptake protein TrkA